MKALGHFFLILFVIVLMFGIYIGSATSKLELERDNQMRSMPLNSYDFNSGAILVVWVSGLGLLIAAMVFYWMDHVTSTLDGLQSTMNQIAENTKRAVAQSMRKTMSNDPVDDLYATESYSKPGDAPAIPGQKGRAISITGSVLQTVSILQTPRNKGTIQGFTVTGMTLMVSTWNV